MTIYEFSVISTTGFPYYTILINPIPEGVKIYLRFFDFSQGTTKEEGKISSKFELMAGLISALFEFSRCIDKKIFTLEFKSGKETTQAENSKNFVISNSLITCSSETFLIHNSVSEKVKMIYNNIIAPKTPLESADSISKKEEEKILDILTDAVARQKIAQNKSKIETLTKNFLRDMGGYGLKGICITSFDLSPIVVFGEEYSFQDVEVILRNMGMIPEIKSFEWEYRQSFLKENQVWLYIINSGTGVTIENQLFEPYFYLLFADPYSYLGEFPAKLTREFNKVFD